MAIFRLRNGATVLGLGADVKENAYNATAFFS